MHITVKSGSHIYKRVKNKKVIFSALTSWKIEGRCFTAIRVFSFFFHASRFKRVFIFFHYHKKQKKKPYKQYEVKQQQQQKRPPPFGSKEKRDESQVTACVP